VTDVVGGAVGSDQFVDLHMHSTASDGTRAPRDVVTAAKAVGLAAIALTDHDTLAGLEEAFAAGAELGVRVIPGVELSAVEGERGEHETHILGLHLSNRTELERRLMDLRGMRERRADRIVRRLNELGVPITMDLVLKEAAGGAVGRPHVARALIAGKWVGDQREAFDRYLGNGRQAFVAKEQLSARDAMALIHDAGGLAVLAHPGPYATRDRIAALQREGLDGVEVLHPSHSWDDSQQLDAIASELGLVRSGGSDWHGATDGARTLGMMKVPGLWVSHQEARIAERGSRRVA
jgi:predicted metal-dependent phosphoesterase TrpH